MSAAHEAKKNTEATDHLSLMSASACRSFVKIRGLKRERQGRATVDVWMLVRVCAMIYDEVQSSFAMQRVWFNQARMIARFPTVTKHASPRLAEPCALASHEMLRRVGVRDHYIGMIDDALKMSYLICKRCCGRDWMCAKIVARR